MAICPTCKTALRTVRQREGMYYSCDTCTGRAVTVPQVRRVAGDRFATQLLRRINSAATLGDRPCPFCLRDMRQFQIREPALALDSCRSCGVVWFDPSEFEAVPERSVEPVEKLEFRFFRIVSVWRHGCLVVHCRTPQDLDSGHQETPKASLIPAQGNALGSSDKNQRSAESAIHRGVWPTRWLEVRGMPSRRLERTL